MASADAVSPVLPPELEQIIFEVAALSWPRLIPRLMLVAWRVKAWVEPLLYRTIIVGSHLDILRKKPDSDTRPFPIPYQSLLSLVHSSQSLRLLDSVRNLYIAHGDAGEEAAIFAACSGIENLWLSAGTSLVVLEIQFHRPLKRLHGTLKVIFGASISTAIDLTHSVFASLTHLEIFDFPEDGIDLRVWTALTHLPHLTHLAFDDEDYLPMCGSLLPTWKHLKVLVILYSGTDGSLDAELFADYSVPELADEPRVVLMVCSEYLEDWIKGAHTGYHDYWSQAEDHIARRKSGEVDPAFFRDSVRHLQLVHGKAAETDSILGVCSGVEDLWVGETFIAVSEIRFDRPLKRLHGSLETIFGSPGIDFTRSIFSSLTHLELFNFPEHEIDLPVWTVLTRLPHLTHLAFDEEEYLPVCGALVPEWVRLRVLVILFIRERDNLNAELFAKYNVPELADEPRVVLMVCSEYLEDWIKGAHTGRDDYWSRAEDHIALRKSGKIDLRDCYVPDSDESE
ncbi:hypothetical protein MSAN_00145100 [Mycena sanguinolenta]|uniref:Uncharacterized protein n=1 Tax=Mycena sanguinolenta TaxID=230812 RepID=A0A8H7DLZ3_9AGAR|nr:hypothetical protein MSAN_00145100 [Mycena sanguinolenta]